LHRAPEDMIVPKRRYSAFFGTDLDLHLRERQIATVLVAGVVTNICVRSTVHDAFFLGYEVVVPVECVAATSPEAQATRFVRHRYALWHGDPTRAGPRAPHGAAGSLGKETPPTAPCPVLVCWTRCLSAKYDTSPTHRWARAPVCGPCRPALRQG
jgi:hypothetical protein